MKIVSLPDLSMTLAARLLPGLLSLLALPLYVRALGPSSYGAVGLFNTVQMFAGLLDMGLSASVLREVAWAAGREEGNTRLRTLLRTFEIPFWVVAGLMALAGLFFGTGIIRSMFSIEPESIGLDSTAISLLFIAIGCRFPFAVYFGHLSGQGALALANGIVIAMDICRIVGTVLAVTQIHASLAVFFGCQALAGLATSLMGAVFAYRSAGGLLGVATIDWRIWYDVRSLTFSSGAMSVLFVAANSIDKVLLPRFLTTREFGLYVAVGQLAAIVFLVLQAIWSAQHPRLLAVLAAENHLDASEVFGVTASLMTAVGMGAVFFVWLSAPSILQLWLSLPADSGYSAVLKTLTAGYAAAGLGLMSFSFGQASRTVIPSVVSLMLALIVVPPSAYLMLGGFTPLTGAISWSTIYVLFFLGSGLGLAFLSQGYRFLTHWAARVLAPVSIFTAVGVPLSGLSHEWSPVVQLGAGMTISAIVAALCLAGNKKMRGKARSVLFRLVRPT